jgi:NTP pyrophosphatase (non-canonical NTP hydrolase)
MKFNTASTESGDEMAEEAKAKALLDVTGLQAALEEFATVRDWQRFHSPKNLAMALTGEVGELVELFQWLTEAESRSVMSDPALNEKVQHEIADVMMYLVRLATVLKIDINDAVQKKIVLNARKYPARS